MSKILNYVVSVDFIAFGLTASTLFVLRRRAGPPGAGVYLTPGHPYTTALFVLTCAGIVWGAIASHPADSAVGLVILLAGIPVYLYWSRRNLA